MRDILHGRQQYTGNRQTRAIRRQNGKANEKKGRKKGDGRGAKKSTATAKQGDMATSAKSDGNKCNISIGTNNYNTTIAAVAED